MLYEVHGAEIIARVYTSQVYTSEAIPVTATTTSAGIELMLTAMDIPSPCVCQHQCVGHSRSHCARIRDRDNTACRRRRHSQGLRQQPHRSQI